jgi:hypothetical protein
MRLPLRKLIFTFLFFAISGGMVLAQNATINAEVWDDQNANRQKDGGEPSLSGVTVELRNSSNVFLQSILTDASGIATFSVAPGTYKLRFVPLVDHKFTPKTTASLTQDNKSDATESGGYAGYTSAFTVTAGQTVSYVDAGLWSPGSLVAEVWDDQNANRQKDATEPLITLPVTVDLLETNNSTVIASTTTVNGVATFTKVVPADRKVKLRFHNLPADHKFTPKTTSSLTQDNKSDATENGGWKGFTGEFQVTKGNQTISYVDAGLWSPGSLVAEVWDDRNANRQKDSGEPLIDLPVTVDLMETNNSTVIASTTTVNGVATFTKVVPADRKVKLKFHNLPADHKFTPKTTSSLTQDNKSDAVETGGWKGFTGEFQVTRGNQTISYVDAGLWSPGSLVAEVWDDRNANRQKDATEPLINRPVTVDLMETNNSTVIASTTTVNGVATFTKLVPADRKVKLRFRDLPADHKFTPKTTSSLTQDNKSDAVENGGWKGFTGEFQVTRGNQTISYVDAGLWSPGEIQAQVFEDENGNRQKDASEEGVFGFKVQLMETNNQPAKYPVGHPNANADIIGITDCDGVASLYLPADRSFKLKFVVNNGATFTPKTTASITQDNKSDATQSGGWAGFTGTFAADRGNDLISFVDAGLSALGNYYVTDTDNDKIPDFMDKYPNDATNNGMGAIYSRVWDDLDGDGKQDGNEPDIEVTTCALIKVNLRKSNNDFLQSAFVNPVNGHVAFFDVPIQLSVRMQFVRPNGYSFAAKDASSNNTIDSDVNPNNGYTDVFNFASATVLRTIDAGMFAPGTIKTFVWDDRDGDGKQDNGEPGIAGVNVQLRKGTNNDNLGSAVTDANGFATLTNVPTDRTVRVSYSRPAGHTFAPQDASSDNNIDSDAAAGTPNVSYTAAFQLTKGSQLVTNVDAGLFAPGTIQTFVWDDLDGDGKQDNGEPGIAGVNVQLRKGTNNDNLGSAVTDANGFATLTNVPTDRTVRVSYSRPAGHTFAPKDASSDNSIDSDAAAGTPNVSYTAAFQLTKGSQLVTNVDAGLFAPGTIQTFVWDDLDGDGKQDSGEPGIAGVNVQLRKGTNNDNLGSAVTDANGIATLTNVPTDQTVRVSYSRPAGHTFAPKDASSDNSIDSDAAAGTANISYTAAFQLTKGSQLVTHVDAGLFSPGTVTTFVWDDLDGDGKQDSGEPGLAGVPVKLRKGHNNDVLGSATTNASGIAVLSNVPTDIEVRLSYTTPSGYGLTAKDASSNNSIDSDVNPNGFTDKFRLTKGNQNITTVDAGYVAVSAARVANLELFKDLRLYPVPASDFLNVEIDVDTDLMSNYQIVDFNGKVIVKKQLRLEEGTTSLKIPVRELANGIYVFHVHTAQGMIHKQFVILR